MVHICKSCRLYLSVTNCGVVTASWIYKNMFWTGMARPYDTPSGGKTYEKHWYDIYTITCLERGQRTAACKYTYLHIRGPTTTSNIMSHPLASCYIMFMYASLCYITLIRVTLCYMMIGCLLHSGIVCYIVLYYAILCHLLLYSAMLYYTMVYHAISC